MEEENWESLLEEIEKMSDEEFETACDEAAAESPSLFGDADDYVFVPAKKGKQAV